MIGGKYLFTLDNLHENIQAVKAIMGDFYIGEIMFAIVAFYFGGGAFEGVMEKKNKK